MSFAVRGQGRYHGYNAVLKRVSGGKGRAEMTLAELEVAVWARTQLPVRSPSRAQFRHALRLERTPTGSALRPGTMTHVRAESRHGLLALVTEQWELADAFYGAGQEIQLGHPPMD